MKKIQLELKISIGINSSDPIAERMRHTARGVARARVSAFSAQRDDNRVWWKHIFPSPIHAPLLLRAYAASVCAKASSKKPQPSFCFVCA